MHSISQAGAIKRVKQVEPMERLHLVALEMTDEMPPNRNRHLVHLGKRFLDPVLAHVRYARIPCRERSLRPVGLGDCDDCNLLLVTAASNRFLDLSADGFQPVREVRERHNAATYRKLQSESRETPRTLARLESSVKRGHDSTPER